MKIYKVLMSSVAVFAFGSTIAYAQNYAGDSPGEAAAPPEGEVADGDIIVTAQRRAERLQDVPIAVNVQTGEQLEESGVKELGDLTAVVPGFNAAHSIGSFQPSLRGITTSSTVVENPVALYIDNVYYPQQREGLRELVDTEQVTILKGPQGTLFGRNATGGVIQITTRRPGHEPGGKFSVGYDNYSTLRTSAYLTGGLTDALAASVSAAYSSQGEGWGKSLSSGDDVYKLYHSLSLRGKILLELENTEFTLIGDYLDRRDSGAVYQPYPGTTFLYPGFGPTKDRYTAYTGDKGYNDFSGGGVSLEAEHDFGGARLVSITSYRKNKSAYQFDFDNVAAPLILSKAKAPSEDYTQEIQIVSPDSGRFRWVVGGYYFHNENSFDPVLRVFNGPFVRPPAFVQRLSTFATETTESIAPFAQADYEFLPDTTLTLGFRQTWEKRKISGFTRTQTADGAITDVPTNAAALSISEPTWRLALSHKFADDTLIYASYNRGIKSGGFNIATLSNPGYLPEKLDDYEVGIKTALFDGAVNLNLNGFYYKYDNLQVATFVGITQVVANGAAAELYGLDMDFQARLTDRFSLAGGFELMHSEFKEYPDAVISTPNPAGGVTLVSGSAAGNRLPFAQNFVGSLSASYDLPLSGGGGMQFNLTGTYHGDYFLEADNFLRQPDYVLLNASIKFTLPDERFSVLASATNLLDESIIARNVTQSFGYFVNYGKPPRIVSLTATYEF